MKQLFFSSSQSQTMKHRDVVIRNWGVQSVEREKILWLPLMKAGENCDKTEMSSPPSSSESEVLSKLQNICSGRTSNS